MANILMVDDEEAVLKSLSMLLESDGHKVTAEPDSGKAVDLIKNEEFDLLVTDIRMYPVDGMDLMKLAKTIRPEMPIVVISAYTSDDIVAQAKAHGCVAYLSPSK